jgi:hypothetical protein
MADRVENRAPGWFWVVALLVLLWEAGGVVAYLMQVTMTADQMRALPEGQRQLYTILPGWITAAFAVAVWLGLSGAIGLLMRQGWARSMFIVSLVAAIVQFGWVFAVGKAHVLIGPSAIPMPAAIILIGAALVWFAGYARAKGWLR